MTELRILGIGSPYDTDQLGWQVIKCLQAQEILKPYQPERLELSFHDRPGIRLLELMQNVNHVFIVDAVKSNALPGTLHQFQKEALLSLDGQYSSHGIGVAESIQIGKALNSLPENIKFYGIEIAPPKIKFDYSEQFTNAVDNLTQIILDDILKLLLKK